jgi:hypothetical protein
MDPFISMVFGSRDGDNNRMDDMANEIPRLSEIPNPLMPVAPEGYPDLDQNDKELLPLYRDFISQILPSFGLGDISETETVFNYIQKIVENQKNPSDFCELIIHCFLLNCSEKLYSISNLDEFSILHHSLCTCQDILATRDDFSQEINESCDMLIADVADFYYSKITEVLSPQFWATVNFDNEKSLSKSIIYQDIQKLKLLHKKTYSKICSLLLRRAYDTVPTNGKQKIVEIAKENGITIR